MNSFHETLSKNKTSVQMLSVVPDGAPAPARALAAAPAALGAAQLVRVAQVRPARHQPGTRV